MKKVVFLLFMFVGGILHAQFTINNPATQTIGQIVKNILVGAGVTPLNIKFNGGSANVLNDQAGFWNTNINPTNTGFAPLQKGMILTTGKVGIALGPNNIPNASALPSAPLVGDADLTKLTGSGAVNNVAVLEFDFVATGLELNFDFVFGSEEYPEYVGTSNNDAFGFFLSGPGIAGPYSSGANNIALIPGTNTSVTINNVNSIANSAYYVDNTGGTDLQYDGFTKPMRAKAALQCGGTYHIKLAIGQLGSNQWDSGVLIKNFEIPTLQLIDNLGLADDPTVCYGEPITINSGITVPGAIFEWKKDGAVIPGSGPDLAVTTGGKYTLNAYVNSLASNHCLFASDDITIGYLPPMPINDPKNITLCSPTSAPFTIDVNQTAAMLGSQPSSKYNITYYDSSFSDAHDGTATGIVAKADLATYKVNGLSKTMWVRFEETGGSGCVEVKSFDINITVSANASFSYSNGTFCITETSPQAVNFTGTAGGHYTSSPSGLSLDSSSGAIVPGTSTPGTYTVIYNVDANGSCPLYSSTPVNVEILSGATAAISYSGPYCISTSGQVPVAHTGAAGGVYTATPNGLTIDAATGDVTPSSSLPATYTVSYTVAAVGGCPQLVKTASVEIMDLPHPAIDSANLCLDPDTNEVLPGSMATLDSGLNSADYLFQWNDSSGNLVGTESILKTNAAGVYTLIAKTAGPAACSSTVNMTVGTVYAAKEAKITVSDYFEGTKITVDVVGSGAYLYELDDSGAFQENNVFNNVSPGIHTVTVTDTAGCTHLVYKDILIIDYPRFLTPNNDGYNDTWNITSLIAQQNTEIFIFDRYGKLLKQLSPAGRGWDGTYNGHPLPSADYWFTVKYTENAAEKLFKSHFALKR